MRRGLDNARSLYVDAIQDAKRFIEFFADFVEHNPDRDVEILRAFQDGRYVFPVLGCRTLGNGTNSAVDGGLEAAVLAEALEF